MLLATGTARVEGSSNRLQEKTWAGYYLLQSVHLEREGSTRPRKSQECEAIPQATPQACFPGTRGVSRALLRASACGCAAFSPELVSLSESPWPHWSRKGAVILDRINDNFLPVFMAPFMSIL